MATKKWKPEQGEYYYRIDIFYDEIRAVKETNDNMEIDQLIFKTGNCYKTKTEANKKVKQIKAILKQP